MAGGERDPAYKFHTGKKKMSIALQLQLQCGHV
jgi:hypothetical protein